VDQTAGQVDLARVLGSALSVTNPVIAGLYDASGNRMPSMDSALRPGYVDVIDRAARLLGIVYGSLGQLQQRGTSLDLYTALRQSGSELSTSNPIFSGIVDASGNRMPSMDASIRPGYVDVIDRAARLLGVVYGSQAQQLQQRASTYELLVQIMHQGVEKDPTQIRTLTSSDNVTAVQATRSSLKTQPEREDLTSLGGTASPNNAGVQIVSGTAGQKIKVYDAGYHGAVAGLHYFYFGTSTTATTKRFCTYNAAGLIHQTFVQPRIGDAGDSLYIFASVSESNMPYDIGYVKEA